MKNKGKTVCSISILSLLIVCFFTTSESYSQNLHPLQGEVNKALPDAIDLLIELGQLRRAYVDLQSNYLLYQMDVEMIKGASDDLMNMKINEIIFWKKAYYQENVWYKSVWFGIAIGVIGTAGSIYLAGQL